MWIMALPAEKPLAVAGEVYLGRILSIGFFPVTLSTEFPRFRLRWPDAPRSYLMFHRDAVTARTADESMRGNGFDAGDLRMTGRTFPRSLPRYRVMRVVTRYTSLNRIVENGIYLRESGRP